MIMNLRRDQPSRQRVEHERAPAGAHASGGRLRELLFEFGEAAKIAVNGAGERTGGFATAIGRHVLPENTVQHMARDVECELVLERGDPGEVALVARFR